MANPYLHYASCVCVDATHPAVVMKSWFLGSIGLVLFMHLDFF